MGFDWICIVSGHLMPFKWALTGFILPCIPGAYLIGSDWFYFASDTYGLGVFFCLFDRDLILYVPVNNFSVMSGRVFLG